MSVTSFDHGYLQIKGELIRVEFAQTMAAQTASFF
jgi:hypothetical protein